MSGDISYSTDETDGVTFDFSSSYDVTAGVDYFYISLGSYSGNDNDGVFSLSWNDLVSAGITNNGTTYGTITVYDNAGNEYSESISLSVYNIAPSVSVSLTGDIDPLIFNSPVTVTRSASDVNSYDLPLSLTLELRDNETNELVDTLLTTGSLTGSFSFSVSEYEDGTDYYVKVVAEDDVTTSDDSTAVFAIDNTAPQLSGESVYTIDEAEGVTIDYSSTIDPIAGIIDNEEISSFSGSLNGVSLPFSTNAVWELSRNDLNETYEITNEGTYTIIITTTDSIGNTQTFERSLTVQNVTSEVSVDFGEDSGFPVFNATATTEWDISDVNSYDLPLMVLVQIGRGEEIITTLTGGELSLESSYTFSVT